MKNDRRGGFAFSSEWSTRPGGAGETTWEELQLANQEDGVQLRMRSAGYSTPGERKLEATPDS